MHFVAVMLDKGFVEQLQMAVVGVQDLILAQNYHLVAVLRKLDYVHVGTWLLRTDRSFAVTDVTQTEFAVNRSLRHGEESDVEGAIWMSEKEPFWFKLKDRLCHLVNAAVGINPLESHLTFLTRLENVRGSKKEPFGGHGTRPLPAILQVDFPDEPASFKPFVQKAAALQFAVEESFFLQRLMPSFLD